MKHLCIRIAAVLLFAWSANVFADRAYVGINLVLRAGPDIGYPSVMLVPAGTYVTVYGCLSNYTWCDVAVDGNRGWIAAAYLQYYYDDAWIYLSVYGPRIGVPVVTFVLTTYWDAHYRNATWYSERERWQRTPPQHLPPQRSPDFQPQVPPPMHPPARTSLPTQPAPQAAPTHRPAAPTPPAEKSKQGKSRDKGRGH